MKKSILVALLAILCLAVKAQETFKGIGIFKIGIDTSVLYNYVKENKFQLRAITSDDQYINATTLSGYGIIGKLYHNLEEKDILRHLSNCPEVKEFSISSYDIAGISLKNVRLIYYKDRLFSFECEYNNNAKDAIEAKYGALPVKMTYDTSKCIYNLTGHERLLIANKIDRSKLFGDILLVIIIKKGFDSHCEEDYSSIFKYQLFSDDLLNCEKDNKPKKPEIDKNKLKDF